MFEIQSPSVIERCSKAHFMQGTVYLIFVTFSSYCNFSCTCSASRCDFSAVENTKHAQDNRPSCFKFLGMIRTSDIDTKCTRFYLLFVCFSPERVPVRPVVNSIGPPLDDDLETEAAVMANFDFLQNDVEDEEDNDDELDDGGSADDESDDRDDIRLGRRLGKRAKPGI